MELGIHTFGELVPDPHTHQTLTAQERLNQVIRMAMLADEADLDVFGFGEHHRLDIAASSPPVVLAAVAQGTRRIRLTSTSTVLSTADPVRVFEDFATLDLISGDAPRSSRDAVRSPSPFPSLATAWMTTMTCSRKKSSS